MKQMWSVGGGRRRREVDDGWWMMGGWEWKWDCRLRFKMEGAYNNGKGESCLPSTLFPSGPLFLGKGTQSRVRGSASHFHYLARTTGQGTPSARAASQGRRHPILLAPSYRQVPATHCARAEGATNHVYNNITTATTTSTTSTSQPIYFSSRRTIALTKLFNSTPT